MEERRERDDEEADMLLAFAGIGLILTILLSLALERRQSLERPSTVTRR